MLLAKITYLNSITNSYNHGSALDEKLTVTVYFTRFHDK